MDGAKGAEVQSVAGAAGGPKAGSKRPDSKEEGPPDRGTANRWLRILWPFALFAVAVVALYPALVIQPAQWDTCMFRWFGQRVAAGELFYQDIWDHKLPPIVWINAVAAATGRQAIFLYLLQVLSVAASGWMIASLAGWMFPRGPARLAGLAYVTLACLPAAVTYGNLTEHWGAPFVILCVWAAVRIAGGQTARLGRWAAVSGFALGVAGLLRPPVLLIAAALLGLTPMLSRLRVRRSRTGTFMRLLLGWLAGLLAAPALLLLVSAATCQLGPVFRDGLLAQLHYGGEKPPWAHWTQVWIGFRTLFFGGWPWELLAAHGVFMTLAGRSVLRGGCVDAQEAGARGDEGVDGRTREIPASLGSAVASSLVARNVARRDLNALVLLWLATSGLSAVPGLRGYTHYFYVTIAPTALLTGWFWTMLLHPNRPTGRRTALARGGLALAGLALIGNFLLDWRSASQDRRAAAAVTEARDYLTRNAAPGQTLFVFPWGPEGELYSDLGWRCPTRHPLALIYPQTPSFLPLLDEWKREMLNHPPDWLIGNDAGSDTADLLAGKNEYYGWDELGPKAILSKLRAALEPRYVLEKRFESDPDGHGQRRSVTVYRRKG